MKGCAIRVFAADDLIEHLTELLHRAYAPLGARALNYTAVDQSVETTAADLIAYYARRGYRHVESVQWPRKRYRSVVLSKALVDP